MSKLRPSLILPVVFVLGACSSAASPAPSASPPPSPSGAPSASPSPSPAADTIEHPTGATDVILRMESGGGFTIIGWAATEAPAFTLYGDGTVVARDDTQPLPDPGPDGLMRMNPFFTAKLPEDQVQSLLRYALADGGLGIARARYEAPVADAGSTTFTVRAGGLDKSVWINALGFDSGGDPDAAIKKAFSALADHLRKFAADMPAAADRYAATSWRAVLLEAEPGQVPGARDWPWTTIGLSDFVADPNGAMTFPMRVLSAADVTTLDLDGIAGGVQNIGLKSPDEKKVFQLALRPLLPGESS